MCKIMKLRKLNLGVRTLLDETFRSADADALDVSDFLEDWEREVDLESFHEIIDECMRRFEHRPETSDSWLAPRIHASLRMTRREASQREVWAFLNVACRPDYVRWRFTSKQGASKGLVELGRFIGEDSRNSLGRLWWIAELTRNGGDYQLSETVTKSTRFGTSWQGIDLMHHRVFALGSARYLTAANGGNPLTDSQSQRFAKAVNLFFRTTHVDSIALSPKFDDLAMQDWIDSKPDYTKFLDELPDGPDEDAIDEEDIQKFVKFFDQIAKDIGLFEDRTSDQLETDTANA